MRICDVPTRLDDAITVAALFLCVLRMLYRLRRDNQRWRQYDRFLINENRWRAQRYGFEKGLIDFGRAELVGYPQLLEELIAFIQPDAEALGCVEEVHAARGILARGTSADLQRNVFAQGRAAGLSERQALEAVVDALILGTVEGV
jgi:carboxylate-amine ligase